MNDDTRMRALLSALDDVRCSYATARENAQSLMGDVSSDLPVYLALKRVARKGNCVDDMSALIHQLQILGRTTPDAG